jgi:prepilin-type processing-associated H-X9-DG protein
MHNYLSAHGKFPLGASLGYQNYAFARANWNNWSSLAMMLPFLEQQPLYNAANFSFAPEWCCDQPAYFTNSTVCNSVIAGFICPSDGNAGRAGPWINNYAASQGTSSYNLPGTNEVTGMFGHQKSYGIADCPDGTSSTIAFSEFLVNSPKATPAMGKGTGNVSGTTTHDRFDGTDRGQAAVVADLRICSVRFETPGGAGVGNGPGSRWSTGAMGYTIFNTIGLPNGGGQLKWSACRVGCCVQAQHAHWVNASSKHSGGVNVLLTDGSVRFIKDSIAYPTWWALGTRDNGETISSDAY